VYAVLSGQASGFGDEPPVSGLARAVGHHAPALLGAAIVAVVLAGLFPPPGALGVTVPVALLAIVLASWVMMRRHDRALCERCVATMPLNPAERAALCYRRFWVIHHGTRPAFLVPYLIVLIGSNFATSAPGRLVWALMQLTMIYIIVAYTTHRRLQPWCPWCSDDGGVLRDDDGVSPPPPPGDRRQPV
jgi:hypothetical protein